MSDWKRAQPLIDKLAAGLVVGREDAAPQCRQCSDTGVQIVDTDLAPSILKADGKPVALRGTGARRCVCVQEQALRDRIAASLSIVPARYQGVTLAGLQPRPHIHPDQPKVIADLKAHPDANYFICGKPDAGKSHFLWALFHHDAMQGRRVFASTLFKLIKGITDQMFGRPPEIVIPDLAVDQISIFLEDVNKARPTEFVYERFFNFIDDAYNRKHRIVVTSQVGPGDLAAHFERADGVDGTAIVRRMNNEDTTIWPMF